MRLRFGIVLFLALGLASCSKTDAGPEASPGGAPARETKAPEAAPDTHPLIVAFGDSLTAGYGLDPGLSYPDLLQKKLDEGGHRYRVVNQGISGDTTSGGLARLETALVLRPAIVILELGANDGLRGLPVSNTRANLDELLSAFKSAGCRILLAGITLPRNYGSDYIREFDSIYRDLAAKHEVPLLPFLLEGVAMKQALMQPDALHPNAQGTAIVAENVFQALQPLLK